MGCEHVICWYIDHRSVSNVRTAITFRPLISLQLKETETERTPRALHSLARLARTVNPLFIFFSFPILMAVFEHSRSLPIDFLLYAENGTLLLVEYSSTATTLS